MRTSMAGAWGGLAGGLLVSAAMIAGRRAGLLHKTLAEHGEDWLDRLFDARRRAGPHAVTIAEQTNHLATSAAFGWGYGLLRPHVRWPATVLGALYGSALYAINIVGIAPRIGMTRGESRVSTGVSAQRLAMHVLFGVATAAIAESLMKPSRH